MIEIRRLSPGDEEPGAALAEDEPPDAAALLRDERTVYFAALDDGRPVPAMALYESVGGVRPADDDVVWDFDYTAG